VTVRVLFLGEGTSDSGIVPHIENLAVRLDIEVAITDPDFSRLPETPGRTVEGKLRTAITIGGIYDLIVVHRDADSAGRDARLIEITGAVKAVTPDTCYTPVIPIRMTEAWLLTDESGLRSVAGNPQGRMPLNLPPPARVEQVLDPKKLLKDVLGIASGLSGRRLDRFHTRFGQHRRQLLERLDPDGNIVAVPSWKQFVSDLESALRAVSAR
jgi:hypothetical protein